MRERYATITGIERVGGREYYAVVPEGTGRIVLVPRTGGPSPYRYRN